MWTRAEDFKYGTGNAGLGDWMSSVKMAAKGFEELVHVSCRARFLLPVWQAGQERAMALLHAG